MTVEDAASVREAFSEAVKWAGLRDKERCEATFPVFDAALDRLVAEVERLQQERDERITTAAADEWLLHRFNRTYDELCAARAEAGKLRATRDRLRTAIEHVVADSPGTPESVKQYLTRALAGSDAPPTLSEPDGEDVRTTTRSTTSRQGPSERAPAPSGSLSAAAQPAERET